MGVHGQGAREGEEGLGGGEVVPEGRVGGEEDVGDQTELGDGRGEGGEHEVADAEGREAGYGWGAEGVGEDEEEDLADVVVALEVVEVGVAAEDFEDQVGEEGFLVVELGVVFVWGGLVGGGGLGEVGGGGRTLGVVDECPVDVELDLVFISVAGEVLP